MDIRTITQITYRVPRAIPNSTWLLSLLLLLCAGCGKPWEEDLLELDIRARTVQSRADSTAVVAELMEMLENLPVPDSLPNEIEQQIEDSIGKMAGLDKFPELTIGGNPYNTEGQIRGVVQNALAARLADNTAAEDHFFSQANRLALQVDCSLQFSYWVPWLTRVKDFDTIASKSWLTAVYAHNASRSAVDNIDFSSGCYYGAIALSALEKIDDKRLYLDVVHRLVYGLYHIKGYNDLGIIFAKSFFAEADSLNYHTRRIGLRHHMSRSMFWSDSSRQAARMARKIINLSNKYINPEIIWGRNYKEKSHLTELWVLNRQGQFLKVLDKADSLLNEFSITANHIELINTQGNSLSGLGKFSEAIEKFRLALKLAEENNLIELRLIALNNISDIYRQLYDFQMAHFNISQAVQLMQKSNWQVLEQRCLLLSNYADCLAALDSVAEYRFVVNEISQLMTNIKAPRRSANFSRNLAIMEERSGFYDNALKHYLRAYEIYKNIQVWDVFLETRTKYIGCLINADQLTRAKEEIQQLLDIDSPELMSAVKMDMLGLKARLAQKAGQSQQAMNSSNALIRLVEKVSNKLEKEQQNQMLRSYRQRAYEYLKDAVRYEITSGTIDSAFIKLDYSKSWELRKKTPSNRLYLDIDELKHRLNDDECLINFFLDDSLLTLFVMYKGNILPVNISLENRGLTPYLRSFYANLEQFKQLGTTGEWHHSYRQIFDISQQLGSKLLLKHRTLQQILAGVKTAYIVPDASLYHFPMSSLVTGIGHQASFLVENVSIVNLASAEMLTGPTSDPLNLDPNTRILVCYGDDFRREARRFLKNMRRKYIHLTEVDVKLPDISDEMHLIDRLSGKYDVYIFISHGRADRVQQDRSLLEWELNIPGEPNRNLNLYASDMQKIQGLSDAKAVFLIGCETIIGAEYLGEGVLGIQRAIADLEVPIVIASSWKLDAKLSINQLGRFFHDDVLKLKYPALMMQAVHCQDIKIPDQLFGVPHPYLWAGLNVYQTRYISEK